VVVHLNNQNTNWSCSSGTTQLSSSSKVRKHFVFQRVLQSITYRKYYGLISPKSLTRLYQVSIFLFHHQFDESWVPHELRYSYSFRLWLLNCWSPVTHCLHYWMSLPHRIQYFHFL